MENHISEINVGRHTLGKG